MSRAKLIFLVACRATLAEIIPCVGSNGFDVTVYPVAASVDEQILTCPPDVVIEHKKGSSYGAFDANSDLEQSLIKLLPSNLQIVPNLQPLQLVQQVPKPQ